LTAPFVAVVPYYQRMADQPVLTRNVFVAGGTPVVTYNPRDDRHLETEVRSYLDQGGKALSVSGPTKSGKTVLIERLLPRDIAVWMHGSDLTSVEAFWHRIIDWLGLYDQVGVSTQTSVQGSAQVSGTVGVPIARISGSLGTAGTTGDSITWSRQRQLADVAREGLTTLPVPIVIDDFHYVPDEVKRDVARAVKSLIPITHVVMIAVPHEAFDAIQQEPDMGGRVWQLRIESWTEEELRYISRIGFDALNINDRNERIGRQLSAVSYGAPFLMQQLCYDVAVAGAIRERQAELLELTPPPDWNTFFHRIANRSVPPVFEKLITGPRTRGQERIDRTLKDGRVTDIYGAVLIAAAKTGPKTRIRYQEITRILDADLVEPARGQQVASSLAHMAVIAGEARGTGDAAVAYKDDEFFILDPFLAFYLRFGDWDPTRSL
jgi:hypothetical protein